MKIQSDELTFGYVLGGHVLKCSFCFNTSHLSCCGFGEDRVKTPWNDWTCTVYINHTQLILLSSEIQSGTGVNYSVLRSQSQRADTVVKTEGEYVRVCVYHKNIPM